MKWLNVGDAGYSMPSWLADCCNLTLEGYGSGGAKSLKSGDNSLSLETISGEVAIREGGVVVLDPSSCCSARSIRSLTAFPIDEACQKLIYSLGPIGTCLTVFPLGGAVLGFSFPFRRHCQNKIWNR